MKTPLALIGVVVLPGTMASLGEDPADEDVLIGFGGTVIGCVVLTMTAFLLTVGGCLCCSEERLKVKRRDDMKLRTRSTCGDLRARYESVHSARVTLPRDQRV